eukprot:84241_1
MAELDCFAHKDDTLCTKFYNKSTDYVETLDVLFESFKDTSFVFASPNKETRHEWNKKNQCFLLNIPWNEENVSRILLIHEKTQDIIGHAVVGIVRRNKTKQNICVKIKHHVQIESLYSFLLWILRALFMWFVWLPFKFGFYSCWKLMYIPSAFWVPFNSKQRRFLDQHKLSKVFIKQFCIVPKYQRKGYGQTFMGWILNTYIRNKYSNSPVIIQCISMNARAFYLKIGFKEFAAFKIQANYNEVGNGHRLIWHHDEHTLQKWMNELQTDALFGKMEDEPDIVKISIRNWRKNKMFLLLYGILLTPYIMIAIVSHRYVVSY